MKKYHLFLNQNCDLNQSYSKYSKYLLMFHFFLIFENL